MFIYVKWAKLEISTYVIFPLKSLLNAKWPSFLDNRLQLLTQRYLGNIVALNS